MSHLSAVLFAAIDTGTWSVEQARAWADKLIEKASAPAAWLIELSLATTTSKAADCVRRGIEEGHMGLSEDFAELLTGMLYLQFRSGDLTWQQFEALVADCLDVYGGISGFVDVEAWTEQMKCGPDEIPVSVKLTLERMADRSAEAFKELENVDLLRSDASLEAL